MESGAKKLNEIYDEGVTILDQIETTDLQFNSREFQEKVKIAIENFENCTELVSSIGMFSSNELIDEVSTESLQFLLLPYYLGQLTTKLLNADRQDALKTSEIYYKDFLQRCTEYNIVRSEDSMIWGQDTSQSREDDSIRNLLNAAKQRNSKIEEYRKQKQLEQEISELKSALNGVNINDETKRSFYLKKINYSILKAKEELNNVQEEFKILEFCQHRQATEQNKPTSDCFYKKSTVKPLPLKPIIITKDSVQKAVFGLGYPSLPVLTVNEFYDQRVKEGIFPNAAKVQKMNAELLARQTEVMGNENEKDDLEKIEEEKLEDNDDLENLARLRAKDDYKDSVRRGDGNRHNRS